MRFSPFDRHGATDTPAPVAPAAPDTHQLLTSTLAAVQTISENTDAGQKIDRFLVGALEDIQPKLQQLFRQSLTGAPFSSDQIADIEHAADIVAQIAAKTDLDDFYGEE